MTSPNDIAVSIIIPAYNVGRHVRRCVESVLAQTCRSLEVIVVNDRSTDDTGEVLDQLAANFPALRVVHLLQNVGVHAARAAGVTVARGAYLGFVDGDDWIEPRMFAEMLEKARAEAADIVLCGAFTAEEAGAPTGYKIRFHRSEIVRANVLARFCRLEFGSGVLWNKLYRAEILRPSALQPLERAVDAAEDYIVNVGAFSRAQKVVTLSDAYYWYRQYAGSATQSANRAQSFARTLRAYVVALECFSALGAEVVRQTTVLYTRQLRFESYWVSAPAELDAYEASLAESLTRLAQVYPAGIYPLIHSFHLPPPAPRPTGFRSVARRLWHFPKGLLHKLVRRERWAH